MIGLSLILTYFLMQPVGAAIYQQPRLCRLKPDQIDAVEAVELGAGPLRHFMLKYAREKDLALFLELATSRGPPRPEDLAMRVVVPAYILSELKAGFQIGAALFLPFLVIDMVVAADHHFDRHAAVAAGGDFDSAQDPAVRHGGRLEPAGGFADEKFFLRRWVWTRRI